MFRDLPTPTCEKWSLGLHGNDGWVRLSLIGGASQITLNEGAAFIAMLGKMVCLFIEPSLVNLVPETVGDDLQRY
jgi:hypothetical protein